MRIPASALPLLSIALLLCPASGRGSEGHGHAETITVRVGSLDEAVNTVAYFRRQIDEHLAKGDLDKIHTAAFAARDAATSSVAFASALPEEQRRELAARAARISEIAVQLDKYGDAGKPAETTVFARKLKEEQEALERLTGIAVQVGFTPDVIRTSGEGGHSPSRCPHKARHGGRFSLALNDVYHVEGVYPTPGEFRLYFYDHDSCEIPAAPFGGKVLFKDTELKLEPAPDGTHLAARLPAEAQPPVSLTAILQLPHPKTGHTITEHYSYNFYKMSKPSAPAAAGAATTTTTQHH